MSWQSFQKSDFSSLFAIVLNRVKNIGVSGIMTATKDYMFALSVCKENSKHFWKGIG
jgi:hypothetical protein